TDWAGRSMQRSALSLEDYYPHVGSRLDMIADMDGKQPGDPKLGAEAFLMLAECDNPPVQLLLGNGVLAAYREKIADVQSNLDTWESVTCGVDF
ncbi:MAG: hypothetical protein P8L39_14735, partial [Halioglobus sp.]|nr:hypothetical protein [Halioglobus sp.]